MKWMMFLCVCSCVCSVLGGCSSDTSCNADSDCFSGEICNSGSCSQGTRADAPGNQNSNTTDDSGTPNIGTTGINGSGTPDIGTTGMTPSDTGTITYDTCEVDLMDSSCADDSYEPNDEWIYGKKLSETQAGCQTTSTFVALDKSVEATMCARDEYDWYYIDFTPCVNDDFDIIWTLTYPEECSEELYDFESLSFDCSSDADCRKMDGGATIHIRVKESEQRASQLSYVAVKNLSENFQSNYTLRVEAILK